MEKEMEMPVSSLHKNSSASSTTRFLGLLKQSDSDSVPFELDEGDVVWSAELSDSLDSIPSASSPVPSSTSKHRHYHYRQQRFGLSAALSEDQRPLVHRNSALNPSLSATTAARTIPPVPIPRSRVSASQDYSNSYSGGKGNFHKSAPVNVPVWPRKVVNGGGSSRLSNFNEDDEGTEEEMLPPHEIVARSHSTTFSVFEGVGRTLKGRDLRRVRNAVFQETGFLD